MTTKPARRVKCRFCDYTIPATYRTRSGAVRNWFVRMNQHIVLAHPKESETEERRRIAEEEALSDSSGNGLA